MVAATNLIPPPSLDSSPTPSSVRLDSTSSRSHRLRSHSVVVVTSPPWARDEPPSPTDQVADSVTTRSEPRPSDVTSYHSSSDNAGPGSRWWTFALPRQRGPPLGHDPSRSEKKGLSLKDRTASWLPSPGHQRSQHGGTAPVFHDKIEGSPRSPILNDVAHVSLSPTTQHPFTLSQAQSPGWDAPWGLIAREGTGPTGDDSLEAPAMRPTTDEKGDHVTPWGRRKKCLRAFILSNPYVPLLFRFINITFTTAALAVAIRIRLSEARYSLTGALGSSPTLVIIFAPLTLLHVMAAIYLEYFGRPLGLWRTSAKLAHTLSEVLFICAWSAALSLSFDNFFTSLIPCASPSQSTWYNKLPRPANDVSNHSEGGIGDRLCDDQLALICLVFLGLVMYCINLVISLYRIFEKVKYSMPSAVPA